MSTGKRVLFAALFVLASLVLGAALAALLEFVSAHFGRTVVNGVLLAVVAAWLVRLAWKITGDKD